MIESRKNLIADADAFFKSRGITTKIILTQQKDNLSNLKKEDKIASQIIKNKEVNVKNEINKDNLDNTKIIQSKKPTLNTNSIDQKAKQFADFFNGEIVNLE